MRADIADYVARTGTAPFVWGETDCALWAAGLVKELTGRDPAEPLRGTYTTRWEAHKILMSHGGLLRVVQKMMSGFQPVEADNGVCVAATAGRDFCGILNGGRLYLKTAAGLTLPEQYTVRQGWAV